MVNRKKQLNAFQRTLYLQIVPSIECEKNDRSTDEANRNGLWQMGYKKHGPLSKKICKGSKNFPHPLPSYVKSPLQIICSPSHTFCSPSQPHCQALHKVKRVCRKDWNRIISTMPYTSYGVPRRTVRRSAIKMKPFLVFPEFMIIWRVPIKGCRFHWIGSRKHLYDIGYLYVRWG